MTYWKYITDSMEKSMSYVYNDDTAREAIKTIRKEFTAHGCRPDSYPAAIQKLMCYVAERLPKKIKKMRQIFVNGRFVGSYSETDIPTAIKHLLECGRDGGDRILIGVQTEVPDDQ